MSNDNNASNYNPLNEISHRQSFTLDSDLLDLQNAMKNLDIDTDETEEVDLEEMEHLTNDLANLAHQLGMEVEQFIYEEGSGIDNPLFSDDNGRSAVLEDSEGCGKEDCSESDRSIDCEDVRLSGVDVNGDADDVWFGIVAYGRLVWIRRLRLGLL